MIATLPDDQTTEARLLSPKVNVLSNSCLSFLVYFNITFAKLTIAIVQNPGEDYSTLNFTGLGDLQYPFHKNLFQPGENSRIFRIRLNIPLGHYHVVFIAQGKGGEITIWNIHQTFSMCNNSR